jgi:hypothetical protein
VFAADHASHADTVVMLSAGGKVAVAGMRLVTDGGGLRAERECGTSSPTHQSFWFAWSHFQPGTLVWNPP